MIRSRRLISALFVLFLGCAGAPQRTEEPAMPTDPDVITSNEITSRPATNTYDLVRTLRPSWRGYVIMDGNRLGGLAELQNVPIDWVDSIERIPPIEATSRFGPTVQGNFVILVNLKR